MNSSVNVLNWFEIPVLDFERAMTFYENIFEFKMSENIMDNIRMGFFPYEPGSGKLSGAICFGEWYKPSKNGVMIYFNCEQDLEPVLKRIEAAGGKIILPKTQISEQVGYMAMFLDTEGNQLALHSQK